MIPSDIQSVLLAATVPGCAGGAVSFIYAAKRGRIRNNRLVAKATLELSGAGLTATFLAPVFFVSIEATSAAAFLVGLVWSHIIQVARVRITRVVEAALADVSRRKTG